MLTFFEAAARGLRRIIATPVRCDAQRCLTVSAACLTAFIVVGIGNSDADPHRATMNGVRIANGFPTPKPTDDGGSTTGGSTTGGSTSGSTTGGSTSGSTNGGSTGGGADPTPTPTGDPTPFPTPPIDNKPTPTPSPSPSPTPPPYPDKWSPLDKEIGYDRVNEEWVADGEITVSTHSPDNVVMPGTMVRCDIPNMHDFDTVVMPPPPPPELGDPPPEMPPGPTTKYIRDEPLSYKWSTRFGTIHEETDNKRVISWTVPTEPGRYYVQCVVDDPPGDRVTAPDKGSRNDEAITRYGSVIVPTISIKFVQDTVAIGSKDDDAHKAKFEIEVTDEGYPLQGVSVPRPTIVEGTGRDAHNGTSARIEMESYQTDAEGIIRGTLKSGNRLETTKIHLRTYHADPKSGPTASVEQVWSDLGDDAWDYDEYFEYDEPLTIKYRMAYTRDGEEEKIKGHKMEPETTAITGYEWDEDAGEDWDEDGWPDGDYEEQTYSKDDADTSDFDWWSGAVVSWGEVSEDDGTYSVDLFVEYRDDFEVDSVEFNLADTNSYGAEGSLE